MEFTRRGGQHGVAGTPGSLHRSHGDEVAVERRGSERDTIILTALSVSVCLPSTSNICAPALRSQIVISKKGRGGRRYLPYAFTEQGVAMLSSVLRSARAVEVNIAIMRTFVQLRRLMDSNRDLARKIESLEKKYDEQFSAVFAAIKELITQPPSPRKSIGFHP